VGLDRKALREYVAKNDKTILGDDPFTGSENTPFRARCRKWQNGDFEVVWPQGPRPRS
jgi:hypothetical protein